MQNISTGVTLLAYLSAFTHPSSEVYLMAEFWSKTTAQPPFLLNPFVPEPVTHRCSVLDRIVKGSYPHEEDSDG